MSKTWMMVLGVGVVLVGGYFALTSNKVAENTQTSNNTNTEQSAKKMAFGDFVKQGGAYKCEVKQRVSDFENNGTVYINGGNMMGEYNTVAEGRMMNTSFIMKDGYSYTWSSALPNMGFKVKVETSTTGNTSADTSGTYAWNASQIGDYNCEPWNVDQSKFVPPDNITFKDMTSFQGK
jgi:hypothetical protein